MAPLSSEKDIHTVENVTAVDTSSSPSLVDEKSGVAQIDLDRVGETQGYLLDEEQLKQQLGLPANATLKKAADGHTVLIPQPTDDPK